MLCYTEFLVLASSLPLFFFASTPVCRIPVLAVSRTRSPNSRGLLVPVRPLTFSARSLFARARISAFALAVSRAPVHRIPARPSRASSSASRSPPPRLPPLRLAHLRLPGKAEPGAERDKNRL
ncbi:hypothetical protein B0H13DRAFT_2324764 [Mycena leptocephala]|nr:hypothetical protein B0H13DRAFT_2324764 [Mycena leptocephala]